MKLHTLTLHNIASFRDVTMDFDSAPLADTDLFLINGETGSGKSTILDAVCLALYGDTPRLQASKTLGDRDADLPDDISYSDCRRMLRQGTGDGYVTLSFDADGCLWTATWAVQRARKKTDGKLQQKSWTLTNCATGMSLTKDAEIRAKIKDLVGLDFAQFCRTTMLSQGQFAAFLTSNKDEKAELLQKIVGVDIFQKIGSKIYTVTAAKENACLPLLNELEMLNQNRMTPQRLHELADERNACIQLKNVSENLRERLLDMSEWVRTGVELAKKSTAAQTDHSNAVAAAGGKDIVNAKHDLDVFDRTGAARHAVLAQSAAKCTRNKAQAALFALKDKYTDALSALKRMQADADDISASADRCKADLKAMAPIENVLINAAEICRELSNADQAMKTVAAKRRERDRITASTEEKLKPMVEKAVTAEADCRRVRDELQQNLEHARETLLKTDISAKRQRKDVLVAERSKLAALAAAVTELVDCNQKSATIHTAIKTVQKQIADINDKLPEARRLADIAKAARDTQQKAWSAANLAAGQSAKDIRAKLHKGDTCPVCGHTIEAELNCDRLLQQLADEAQRELDCLNTAYEHAMSVLNDYNTRIEAHKAGLAQHRDRLDALSAECDRRTNDIAAQCRNLNIVWPNHTDTALLQYICTERTEAVDAAVGELSQAIAAAEEIEKNIQVIQARINIQNDDIINAGKALHKAKENLLDAEKSIGGIDATIATNNDIIDNINDRLDKVLDGHTVSNKNRLTHPAEFADYLRTAAESYKQLTEQLSRLQEQHTSLSAAVKRCLSQRTVFTDLIADYVGIDVSAAVHAVSPEKTESQFNALVTDATAATANITAAQKQFDEQEKTLADFYADNPDLDRAHVAALAVLSDEQIGQKRSIVQAAANRILSTETALKAIARETAAHNAKRPAGLIDENSDDQVLPEQYRPSQLDEAINKANDAVSQADSRLALIDKMQSDNKDTEAKIATVTAALNRAQAEHNRWKHLCDLLGDSTGRKFRNIALSHILRYLIDGANIYMRQLNDRYTLDVYPGSFNIMVTDRYTGQGQRTANTISGGETFLVSLALALALSDMGELRGCDTLFIDEGFGSLSGAPLDRAINTLKKLHHQMGRRIGIISHIAELREKIPTQIIVERPTGHAATIRITPTPQP